eukprot:TRINITY_DN3697_c0_g2_i1.p1 TRINITY_DN3697_c0_g2~~TRINITY_DN3697_c0_g2_i1.p1  ORF type:complete len:843 (+),score=233.96 TRINITY_DN3697_c0_g2_i1:110-2638(+)
MEEGTAENESRVNLGSLRGTTFSKDLVHSSSSPCLSTISDLCPTSTRNGRPRSARRTGIKTKGRRSKSKQASSRSISESVPNDSKNNGEPGGDGGGCGGDSGQRINAKLLKSSSSDSLEAVAGANCGIDDEDKRVCGKREGKRVMGEHKQVEDAQDGSEQIADPPTREEQIEREQAESEGNELEQVEDQQVGEEQMEDQVEYEWSEDEGFEHERFEDMQLLKHFGEENYAVQGTGNEGGGANEVGANKGRVSNKGGANEGGANEGGANKGGTNEGGANEGGANEGGANEGGTNEGGATEGVPNKGENSSVGNQCHKNVSKAKRKGKSNSTGVSGIDLGIVEHNFVGVDDGIDAAGDGSSPILSVSPRLKLAINRTTNSKGLLLRDLSEDEFKNENDHDGHKSPKRIKSKRCDGVSLNTSSRSGSSPRRQSSQGKKSPRRKRNDEVLTKTHSNRDRSKTDGLHSSTDFILLVTNPINLPSLPSPKQSSNRNTCTLSDVDPTTSNTDPNIASNPNANINTDKSVIIPNSVSMKKSCQGEMDEQALPVQLPTTTGTSDPSINTDFGVDVEVLPTPTSEIFSDNHVLDTNIVNTHLGTTRSSRSSNKVKEPTLKLKHRPFSFVDTDCPKLDLLESETPSFDPHLFFITGDIFGKISVRGNGDCRSLFETYIKTGDNTTGDISQLMNHKINDIKTWNSLVIVVHEDMQVSFWNLSIEPVVTLNLVCQLMTPFTLHEIHVKDNFATLIQKGTKDNDTQPGYCVINLVEMFLPLQQSTLSPSDNSITVSPLVTTSATTVTSSTSTSAVVTTTIKDDDGFSFLDSPQPVSSPRKNEDLKQKLKRSEKERA